MRESLDDHLFFNVSSVNVTDVTQKVSVSFFKIMSDFHDKSVVNTSFLEVLLFIK